MIWLYQHWSISEKWWNILYLTHWLINLIHLIISFFYQSDSFWLARFTHSKLSSFMRLISMICFNADDALSSDLVIESAELFDSSIHFTSIISLRSYDCLRIITSIIRRFSTMMSSLIRQSYSDFESVARMRKMKASDSSIFVRVVFSTDLTSKSWIIA